MSPNVSLAPWRVLDERSLLRTPFLSVRVETIELPDGRIVDDYHQIDMDDFVAIFAQTQDGGVVTLRQYKHGARRVSLTFPGGQMEPGEAPLVAAQRELLEETGMVSCHWRSLGSYVMSSNQRCAMGHFFHAINCHSVQSPCSGDLEDAALSVMTLADVYAAVRTGDIAIVDQITLLTLATHPVLVNAFLEHTL